MNRQAIARIVSVLVGAATLFGLQQGLGVQFYFAIPGGLVVYLAVKVAIGLLWGATTRRPERGRSGVHHQCRRHPQYGR